MNNYKQKLDCPCPEDQMILMQYQGTDQDYDGISEVKCLECGKRVGRWSGKVLAEGELEVRYGK